MLNLDQFFPQEVKVFYHGSSSACGIENMLLPPDDSGNLSEEWRLRNLDRVFFTEDLGLAKIYAGRACNRFGGTQKIYRVVCPVDVKCLSDKQGATVYHAAWAFVEEI